jgi:GNAT superfamily N-acetyltransferase
MDAEQFLEPKKITAEEFLSSRSFTDKALDFLTMGHVGGEYGPEKEVSFDAEGKMTRAEVPTGDPGFFQDPVTALAMGGLAGVKAAGGLAGKAIAAGREALGWVTGGASEVPTLAKAGVKGIVKTVEAKPLAKAAEARQARGVLESITPEARISSETIAEAAGRTTPKATISAEAFLTGKETLPPEIVQPGATSGGKPLPDGLTMRSRKTDSGIVIEAIDKQGEVVGKAEAGEYWPGVFSPDGIQVDPKYQRKGVASALYDSFSDFIPEGAKIDYRNADIFTGEGKLFKNSYDRKRGFSGENLTHEQTAADYVASPRDVVMAGKSPSPLPEAEVIKPREDKRVNFRSMPRVPQSTLNA